MTSLTRESRRMGIVRHHHDGFPILAIQLGKHGEDFLRRSRVQVAGRLVGKDQVWVGSDGSRDGNTLLLDARELPWEMVEPVT